MRSRNVEFRDVEGRRREVRLYFPPDNRPQAVAVFIHCLPARQAAAQYIGRALNDNGLAVLNLDLVRMSEVGPIDGDDILSAVRKVEAELGLPSIFIGHSVGGILSLRAALEHDDVRGLALVSTPSGDTSFRHLLADGGDEEQRIRLGSSIVRIGKKSYSSFADEDVERSMRLMRRALIMFHSPQDEVVDIQSAEKIYRLARHPKSFVALDHADHFLSDEKDARFASGMLSAWARRYLDVHTESTIYADERDNRVSARTGPSGYRTDIIANGYPLVADEPESLGGTDMGPTPYDYLAAALGACTSMTLRMYADHKKLPLESVTTRVRHTKVHVKDCGDCPEEGRRLDRLEREIELEGDLTDQQRARMVEIANRCPVHRTLQSDIDIPTSLAEDPVELIGDQIREKS